MGKDAAPPTVNKGKTKGEMIAAFKGVLAAKGKGSGSKANGTKGKEVSSGKGKTSSATEPTIVEEVGSGKGMSPEIEVEATQIDEQMPSKDNESRLKEVGTSS